MAANSFVLHCLCVWRKGRVTASIWDGTSHWMFVISRDYSQKTDMIFIRESKHNIPICRSSLWKSAPFLLPVGRNYAFQDPHFWAKGAGHPSAVKIRSRHMGCPVKNDDFGGVPPPLRASCFLLRNLFRVTENTACWVPKHIMFRGLKNGSNITSRSRLFAGQSEEANRPFPKPTSGTKLH